MRTIWLVLMLAVGPSACAGDRAFGTAQNVQVTNLTDLPVPNDTTSYGLRPFDSIEVKVLQDPSLGGTYFIDANGQLSFPLIGDVLASGLSARDLGRVISSSLSNGYIVDPDVSVRPTEIRSATVSFGGEIAKPGALPIQTAGTLLRGINQAGGLTEFAKADDVLIMRTINQQQYIGAYNLAAIQRGNYPDPALAPGDVVMVGDSPARRRLASILPYVSLLTTSVVLLDRVAR